MSHRQMHPIQVHNAVVGLKATLSPGCKLLGQCLVETAHRTGTGRDSHEGLSDLPHFVGASPIHKHLRQRFGYLRFVTLVAFEHLGVKLPFPISGNLEILNAPDRSDQIAGVGTIAVSTTSGSAFAPGGPDTLLHLFTHYVFDQDLDSAHG